MKVLDAGTVQLSNADVLKWITKKRTQHAAEDAQDRALGRAQHVRPQNLISALNKHERELSVPNKYPFTRNPTSYSNGKHEQALRDFDKQITETIIFPLEKKFQGRGMSRAELEKTLGKQQEMKSLTEPELNMILNHAPQNVEVLQPMIEGWAERFTDDELENIVKAVMEVLRVDQQPIEASAAEGG